MRIPVLVEPIENQGFRVTGGPGLDFVAQGETADEALSRFRAEIEAQNRRGRNSGPRRSSDDRGKPVAPMCGVA